MYIRESEQFRNSDKFPSRRDLPEDQSTPRVEDSSLSSSHRLKDVLTGRVIIYGLQSLLSRVVDE